MDGKGIKSFKISGNKNEKPLVIFVDSKTGKYMIPEDFSKDKAEK